MNLREGRRLGLAPFLLVDLVLRDHARDAVGSGFHLGKDKVTKSPAHQWIKETVKNRFYKAVTPWPSTQPSKVGC
jgi:hypothetical protein